MSNYIYVPLEHIDKRYTIHLDKDIKSYLDAKAIEYIRVDPPKLSGELPKGMFLDAAGTIKTKSHQINMIAKLYEMRKVTNETTFFFSDLWFPGIESLAYLNYFYKVNPKITGIIHAGSFTDTDFVRDMERWAKNFEDIVFDISSKIYVASDFIKKDIIKKRIINPEKLKVTPLPLDSKLSEYYNTEKENIVLFNGRICDEKQPWLFDKLKQEFSSTEWKFISTQELNLSKDEYYKLLARSKAIVSFALQENFGYGIAEASYLGCVPIVPNRLVYPELYSEKYLYNNWEELTSKLVCAMTGSLISPQNSISINNNSIKTWFQ